MYRNCYYDSFNGSVFLRTWSEEGVRIDTEMPFSPYLYTEDERGKDATSIFKTPLKKHVFRNSFERSKFVKDSSRKRFFGNLPPDQQFLIDMYRDTVHSKDFSKFPLKVYYFDIETFSPTSFPMPKEAKDPVILITIYNSLNNQIDTWGVEKEYTPKSSNVRYHKCNSESELFEKFINFWKADPPDIFVGWNSEQFDIPYIINRGRKLLNDDFINQLSPLKKLHYREFRNDFGQETGKWIITGISCIDYMDLYKKFSKGDRESYSLNYISEYELKEGKLAINATNLSNLAETDWENFVDYNIQDVNLLIKLDEKLNYLNIVRLLAYKGCTNFESALGKIAIVTGAMSLQAGEQEYVIPTFVNEEIRDSLAGGFVKDPVRGLHESIVSFDVNSLYPNTIITLNISSETKLGKIVTGDYEKDEKIEIKLVNGKVSSISTEKFKEFIKKEKVAVSKAGVLYSQKFKGVCPNLINKIYAERVEAKKKMKDLQLSKKKDKETLDSIIYYDTLQYTLKILLNSIYGVFANKHSPFMDIDNASSITLTGQAVAKAGSEILRQYANKKYGVTEDIVVYNDTDSCYITITPILKKLGIKLTDETGVVSKEAHDVVNDLDKVVNIEVIKWAKDELNSIDPRFEFKREAIAGVGAFLQKKRYIIQVLDDEGIAVNKFKYVGVEIARSTTPKKVKELIKKTVETAFLTKDVKQTNAIFREAYEEFKHLDIQDASFRRAVKDYEKYGKTASLSKFEKGTPCHVKAAIAYNLLLEKYNLQSKYEKINSGQKIKYFYATKNAHNLDAVAFVAEYPKEFRDLIKIDYDKMFEKIVAAPVESVYEAIEWRMPNFSREVQTDLFDLFGE
jgi:DNA polymerase elongation subunit (family B)